MSNIIPEHWKGYTYLLASGLNVIHVGARNCSLCRIGYAPLLYPNSTDQDEYVTTKVTFATHPSIVCVD